MAIKCYKMVYSNVLDDHIKSYVADTEEDVPNLPQSAPMSDAFIVDGGAVYVVNASGEWKEV